MKDLSVKLISSDPKDQNPSSFWMDFEGTGELTEETFVVVFISRP
jgi:hypothetical protein